MRRFMLTLAPPGSPEGGPALARSASAGVVLTLLLAAALSSFIPRPSAFVHAQDKGEPTKPALSTVEGETAPPIEEPTKAPPPDEHSQPEKTPTPVMGLEPTKVPTRAEVTKTPTWSPSSMPTYGSSDTPIPTQESTRTPSPMHTPTTVPTTAVIQVTGVVFDDANANGHHDSGEPGLPGVAVVVEEGNDPRQVLVTDSEGAYRVLASASAVVKVIPPAGWQTTRAATLPALNAGDFPLRRVEGAVPASSTTTAAPQATTLTQAVYDFGTLALAVAALGATIFIAMERLRRALATQFNSWALTHIRLSRESLHITRQTQAVFDDPLRILNQAALDATGENVNLIALPQTVHAPYPAIVTLADDRRRFIFTPIAPEIMRRRENRHRAVSLLNIEPGSVATYPLDALNSSLFIADDLIAIYTSEIKKRSASDLSALPRVQRWYLYVAPSPGDHTFDRRTYLRRRIPTLRAILRR